MEHFEAGTVDLQNLKWSPDGVFIAIWDSCLYVSLTDLGKKKEKKKEVDSTCSTTYLCIVKMELYA
ncbi:hypothetical protein HPULCUR_006488 [Helicostylum pulchrum]|uniref:Uncharacterized protein n=1 Tax=Helicostylum pulchrum TaxID=562976 RepID=A0ABP9Y225_9FUNG